MRTKKIRFFLFFSVYLPLMLMSLSLSLSSCGESPISDSPGVFSGYRVVFHTGEGQGVAPFPQTVAPGNIIELPGQENMTHSTGKVLSGWRTGGTTYNPYYRYTVNGDVEFTAQWSASTSNPGGTTPGGTTPGGTDPGGTTPGGSDPGGSSTSSFLVDELERLRNTAVSGSSHVIVLTADESIPPQRLDFSRSVTITLRGDGANRTISLSSIGTMFSFPLGGGVTLVLDNNITLRGRSNNTNSMIYMAGGRLIMNAGATITGNGGGGVSVGGNGHFTMNGGTISGNTTRGSGGGVGLGVGGNFFTMNGGTISGNTAAGDGGGVSMNFNAFFTMNGGTISGNTANRGGGIANDAGNFTMKGGTITGNTARERGGGMAGGTFSKTDGIITGYASDPVNGNVVRDSSGAVQSYQGHAVHNGNKRKETTAGPDDNLYSGYNNENWDVY